MEIAIIILSVAAVLCGFNWWMAIQRDRWQMLIVKLKAEVAEKDDALEAEYVDGELLS